MLDVAQLEDAESADNASPAAPPGPDATQDAPSATLNQSDSDAESTDNAATAAPPESGTTQSTSPAALEQSDSTTAALNDTLATPASSWTDTLTAIPDRFGELVGSGGPVITILLMLSIAALSIILLKWMQFTMLRLSARNRINKALALWCDNQPEAAIEQLQKRRQPVAQLARLAMVSLRKSDIDPALIREELSRVANVHLEHLRSHLRALEIIATLSPLLGLLGTVLGMIEAFRQLEQAGSQVDPAILSGGIWQALLTTAVGLSVAIPAVMAHAWLERKVERCGHFMEDTVTQIFTRSLKPVQLPEPVKPMLGNEPEPAVTHAA